MDSEMIERLILEAVALMEHSKSIALPVVDKMLFAPYVSGTRGVEKDVEPSSLTLELFRASRMLDRAALSLREARQGLAHLEKESA